MEIWMEGGDRGEGLCEIGCNATVLCSLGYPKVHLLPKVWVPISQDYFMWLVKASNSCNHGFSRIHHSQEHKENRFFLIFPLNYISLKEHLKQHAKVFQLHPLILRHSWRHLFSLTARYFLRVYPQGPVISLFYGDQRARKMCTPRRTTILGRNV